MAFILKVMERGWSPEGSDIQHSLYADIVSVDFNRAADGSAEARLWVREPIKTAMVPGFCEVEKLVAFTGVAYVMNEQGKTISSFSAIAEVAPAGQAAVEAPNTRSN